MLHSKCPNTTFLKLKAKLKFMEIFFYFSFMYLFTLTFFCLFLETTKHTCIVFWSYQLPCPTATLPRCPLNIPTQCPSISLFSKKIYFLVQSVLPICTRMRSCPFTDSLPMATPLRKKYSPFPSNHQLPIPSWAHLPSVLDFQLALFCVDNHSCWDFICAIARSCPEVSTSPPSSPSSSSSLFSSSSSAMFPEPQGSGCSGLLSNDGAPTAIHSQDFDH